MTTKFAPALALAIASIASNAPAQLVQRVIDGEILAIQEVGTGFPFRYLNEFRSNETRTRATARGLWIAEPAPVGTTPAPSTEETTVYVTRTGEKYHRAGCRYLARSQIPIQLREASARYGPCSVCKPVTLKGPPGSAPAPTAPKTTTPSRAVSVRRCQATTKKGTQCSRNAQTGRSYCWQH